MFHRIFAGGGNPNTSGGSVAVSQNSNTSTGTVQTVQTVHNVQNIQHVQGIVKTVQTVHVKKEPEDIPCSSTSSQTISLSVEPNLTSHQATTTTTTLIDANSMDTSQQQQQQQQTTHQIVTQHENTDGTTSLSIAQVQTLQGHQLTLGNLNQVSALFCALEKQIAYKRTADR